MQQQSAPMRRISVTRAGLDAPALAHARLLADPCNAKLAPPVYTTPGTRQLVRIKDVITPGNTSNNDVQFFFQPGQGSYWWGQTTAGATGSLSGDNGTSIRGISQSFRCVAACLKVRYMGTEQNRAGLVGLYTGPNIIRAGAGGVGNSTLLGNCQQVMRTGEVAHEVKWAPGMADENFTYGGNATDLSSVVAAVCGGVNTNNATVWQFELIAVYEIVLHNAGPAEWNTSDSRNTLSDVMRFLGPSIRWAFSLFPSPVVKAVGGLATAYFEGGGLGARSVAQML